MSQPPKTPEYYILRALGDGEFKCRITGIGDAENIADMTKNRCVVIRESDLLALIDSNYSRWEAQMGDDL